MQLVGNAYLVAGGPESIQAILAHLKKSGIETKGNPDAYVRTLKQCSVEEARGLRERASLKPLGERRIFVIAAADINREAQNALLKTLEEPSSNALFIFIVPSPQTLLPTLRSRMQILHLETRRTEESLVDAKRFLVSTPQKRLDLLKPLLEKGQDEKRDLGAIIAFLSSLESASSENPESLHAIYRARKYITDRGALVKPLLEQVALLIPRM